MSKAVFPAILAIASIFATDSFAQKNSAIALFDSPIKADRSMYDLGESVVCTLQLPPTSFLFGATEAKPLSDCPEPAIFLVSELEAPFRVWTVDETCALLSSWTTAFPGPTMTGIAFDSCLSTYWGVDTAGNAIHEFECSTGAPTGQTRTLPPVEAWGGSAMDDNSSLCGQSKRMYIQNIGIDFVLGIDLLQQINLCFFNNPDNTGSGAFGNGIDDAVAPSECRAQHPGTPADPGGNMVISSGTLDEGQVTRVSQHDCTENQLCYNTWDVGLFSSFINGIVEFDSCNLGAPALLLVDNVASSIVIVHQPPDNSAIGNCQNIDGNAGVLSVQGLQESQQVLLSKDSTDWLIFGITNETAGNGRFTAHLNAGPPTASTLDQLPLSLGTACHPLLTIGGAAPLAVWNGIGRPDLLLSSNYFGTPIPDPDRAPEIFHADLLDCVNFPAASTFTLQAVIFNPAATSPRGVSLTNAFEITFE